ncbi:LAME_0G13256g1_1 [Lachancea meyersii CBS 8951]|uniref:N-acetylglucosaminylphosphatidylinositol deacetylase n=1 Tax=Lachancea meyersii CBS 8951 TaxID=1266667 RepID=A0A1G4KA20_9SACH|nr:LAME_0G13256g1_1 [Lachancea meyersii CBS 8951]
MRILSSPVKLVLLLFVTYLCSSGRIHTSNMAAYQRMFSNIEPTSVNLIIAHPDDEVMFFAPVLLQLDSMLHYRVVFRVFSLTNGGADGLGGTRARELKDSLHLLMHRKHPSVEVLNFVDGMDEEWDLLRTTRELESRVTDSVPAFITFDDRGISNHINHISCYKTVQSLKSIYTRGLYYRLLSKESVFQTYTAFVPALLHLYRPTESIVFVSSFKAYLLSFATMLNAHVSQMVWFRYGWWLFSYYVFANELEAF